MEDSDLLRQQLKTPRVILFIVTAITFASAFIFLPVPEWRNNPACMITTLVVAAIYLGLALWARKRPYSAMLIGLAFFVIVTAGMLVTGRAAFAHWPSKIIGICLLLMGLGDARDAQRKLRAS